MFDNDRTIFKDMSNKTFVYRYEKTRKDEEEKKKRVVPDLCKLIY
jgi:hypothetical protein